MSVSVTYKVIYLSTGKSQKSSCLIPILRHSKTTLFSTMKKDSSLSLLSSYMMKNWLFPKPSKSMKLTIFGLKRGKAKSYSYWLSRKNMKMQTCWSYPRTRAWEGNRKNKEIHSSRIGESSNISMRLRNKLTRTKIMMLKTQGKLSSGEPTFWWEKRATVVIVGLAQAASEWHHGQVIFMVFRTGSCGWCQYTCCKIGGTKGPIEGKGEVGPTGQKVIKISLYYHCILLPINDQKHRISQISKATAKGHSKWQWGRPPM